ncbi:hypothetical protein MA20_45405 [Bradyrhizobium japonicum]|uniref:Uncharacterized protein n=1 Tax=Bradyrhizobium japonicum TaxID=375 RepID=A0A0A3XFN3_BRAJP|nr:hypothetical protein MA20_45405 [Bradyrhizobium japonicum]
MPRLYDDLLDVFVRGAHVAWAAASERKYYQVVDYRRVIRFLAALGAFFQIYRDTPAASVRSNRSSLR